MKTKITAVSTLRALTSIEILTIILIVGFVAAIIIGGVRSDRDRDACIENLKKLDGLRYEMVTANSNREPRFADLMSLMQASTLKCPSGGNYSMTADRVTCDYLHGHAVVAKGK